MKYLIVNNGNGNYTVMQKEIVGYKDVYHCEGYEQAMKYTQLEGGAE